MHHCLSDAFCRDVDLSYNTELSSIDFDSLGIYTIYMGRAHEGLHVPRILAQIMSLSIREVIIRVTMDAADNLGLLDWSTIKGILECPNYRSLQKLIVSGLTGDLLHETKTWLKNTLPGCNARGIIECR
jgi:hypothetical protein